MKGNCNLFEVIISCARGPHPLHIHFGAVIQTLVRLSVWQTVCLAERGMAY